MYRYIVISRWLFWNDYITFEMVILSIKIWNDAFEMIILRWWFWNNDSKVAIQIDHTTQSIFNSKSKDKYNM